MDLTKDDDGIQIPSPVAKSSSPLPPNAPSETPSTIGVSSTLGTTSSSFESRPNYSLFSSRTTPSPQPNNPFIYNLMDAPTRVSHPFLIQSHPSMDVTLTLSLITPLDYMFKTSSPPPPPPLPSLIIVGWSVTCEYVPVDENYYGTEVGGAIRGDAVWARLWLLCGAAGCAAGPEMSDSVKPPEDCGGDGGAGSVGGGCLGWGWGRWKAFWGMWVCGVVGGLGGGARAGEGRCGVVGGRSGGGNIVVDIIGNFEKVLGLIDVVFVFLVGKGIVNNSVVGAIMGGAVGGR
ncbi:hypothetical protein Tco_0412817 [Tanacetum coccineum]